MKANSYFEALGKVAGQAIEEKIALLDAKVVGNKALCFLIPIASNERENYYVKN